MHRLHRLSDSHPLLRGMAICSVTWPLSNLIKQKHAGKSWENIDWKQAVKFGIYGTLYVAPTFFVWIRTASIVWPKQSLKSSIIKAVCEQLTYGPFTVASFYICTNLLDGKSLSEAKEELGLKFWPTYKAGVFVWPILQTINYNFIPEKNRLVFSSVCGFIWTIFLAYMKDLEIASVKY